MKNFINSFINIKSIFYYLIDLKSMHLKRMPFQKYHPSKQFYKNQPRAEEIPKTSWDTSILNTDISTPDKQTYPKPTIKDQIRESELTSSNSNIAPIVPNICQAIPQNISISHKDIKTADKKTFQELSLEITNQQDKLELTGSNSNTVPKKSLITPKDISILKLDADILLCHKPFSR